MAVPKRVRFEVLRRDEFTCRYCGAKAPDVALEVDHVVPVALGGDDTPGNLVTACHDCNAGKASTSLDGDSVEEFSAKQEQWQRAKRAAAEEMAQRLESEELLLDQFGEAWDAAMGSPKSEDWRASIHTFMSLGLGPELIVRAVNITRQHDLSTASQWRYFCGVCWNLIRDLQSAAGRLLDDGTTDGLVQDR